MGTNNSVNASCATVRVHSNSELPKLSNSLALAVYLVETRARVAGGVACMGVELARDAPSDAPRGDGMVGGEMCAGG